MTKTTGSGSPTNAPTAGTPSEDLTTWRLSPAWAHFGGRLDDVFREAIDAPYSRCMQKRAAGQQPGPWDYVMDMADTLERT